MVIKSGQQIKDEDPALFALMGALVDFFNTSPEWEEVKVLSVKIVVTVEDCDSSFAEYEQDIPIRGVPE